MFSKLRLLFPGNKIWKLIGFVLMLFFVSTLDMIGVAAILPVIDLATGADPSEGYLSVIYNLLGQPSQEAFIIIASVFLVLSFILKGVFSLIVKWYSAGFIAYQQTATSATLMKRFIFDDYVVNRKKTTSEIIRDVGDSVSSTYSLVVNGILAIIGDLFSIILIMIVLALIMPVPALFALLYFAIAGFLLQKILSRKNLEVGNRSVEAALATISASLDAATGYREARLFGVGERLVYNYQEKALISNNAARARSFLNEIPKYILEIIFIFGIALILGLLIWQGGAESAPYLLVFAAACVRILPSYTRIVASLGLIRSGQAAFEIVESQLRSIPDAPVQLIAQPSIGEFARVNQQSVPVELEVDGVSYTYPDGKQKVLNDISFAVAPGTSLALVGGSGSGKTTLIDILLGLIRPQEGQVRMNGVSIANDLDSLLLNTGYVPQNVFFGSTNLIQAIAFGKTMEEIDIDRVNECIRLAELEDVVELLEDGIYTSLGDQGSRLSGGQKQRVGIARALYRNPSMLVLDEATSALDNETEHKITETMQRLSQHVTLIVVAHRLSTVRHVDQLLFMKDGRIANRGSFSRVRAENPEFARLVELGQLPE